MSETQSQLDGLIVVHRQSGRQYAVEDDGTVWVKLRPRSGHGRAYSKVRSLLWKTYRRTRPDEVNDE